MKNEMIPGSGAAIWTQALRSGKYSQGKYVLQSPVGYCCLGVGVKEYEKCFGVQFPRTAGGELKGASLMYFKQVQHWLGLEGPAGAYTVNGVDTSLARNNDYNGMTFEQIADIIDSRPEGLFK